jgi:hypothetical protein
MATRKLERDVPEERDLVSPDMEEVLVDTEAAAIRGAQTPCEALGQHEILAHQISVTRNDLLQWRMFVCNTPGRAVLHLLDSMGHRATLLDQPVPPPNPIARNVMPPTPPPGQYTLVWALAPSGTEWQTVAEVLVNGVVVLRHFKSHTSNEPFPRGFLGIQVL